MKLIKRNSHLLVLCAATIVFFVRGTPRALHSSQDFVAVYTGARCLVHGCNPYDTSQLEQQYLKAGGRPAELPSWQTEYPLYPPSTFLALSPLAIFSFPVARFMWFLLNGCLFVGSAAFILSMCTDRHRWLATSLVSIIVASGGNLLALGQPAIVAISLLVIGVCLLVHGRLLPLGALLLMLSLAVKPQIGALIVLYFLVKRVHWRYASLALVGAFAILLSAGVILKMHPRSANWISALRTNISSTLKPGGVNNPRPGNRGNIGALNLQAVTGVFFADARTLNMIAYAIFVALLAAWVIAVIRAERSLQMHFLAVGALAALTLTPVYHLFYDARLLLLTVPAAVIVFQKRRLLGAAICVLMILLAISVQGRVQQILLHNPQWQHVLHNKFLFVLLLRQQNLELLILFCLCVYAIFSIRFPAAPAIESEPAHPQVILSPADR